MVRFLSWNVKVINNHDRSVLLKNVLRDWNCDLVCLQQTKLEDVEASDICSIWENHQVGFAVVKAIADTVIGSAGGILVLWKKTTLHLVSLLVVNF